MCKICFAISTRKTRGNEILRIRIIRSLIPLPTIVDAIIFFTRLIQKIKKAQSSFRKIILQSSLNYIKINTRAKFEIETRRNPLSINVKHTRSRNTNEWRAMNEASWTVTIALNSFDPPSLDDKSLNDNYSPRDSQRRRLTASHSPFPYFWNRASRNFPPRNTLGSHPAQ